MPIFLIWTIIEIWHLSGNNVRVDLLSRLSTTKKREFIDRLYISKNDWNVKSMAHYPI